MKAEARGLELFWRNSCVAAIAFGAFNLKSAAQTFSDVNWSSLGSGVNGSVRALAVSGTNIYAGGLFTSAGGVTANHVAKWNGSMWSALGSGMDSSVLALAVSGTN